jgi:hypothetical protein
MRWIVAAGLLGTLVGCLGSKTVQCANGVVCPEGLACAEPPAYCSVPIVPADADACGSMPELTPCGSGTGAGLCRSGTCTMCTPEQIDCPYDGWTQMLSPVNSNLLAIAVTSERDILAAGDGGTVLHYDGMSWTEVHGISAPVEAIASSPTVQLLLTNAKTAYRYAGGALTAVALPPQNVDLAGAWADAANHVVCAGSSGLVTVFDGNTNTWSPTTTSGSMGAALAAVWGRASNDVYAVGNGGAVQHFDGAWPPAINVPTPNVILEGIWGTNTQLFAVGHGTAAAPGAAIISGVTAPWTRATLPGLDHPTDDLRGVWGRGTDVFVVGTAGTILHGVAGTWTPMTNPSGAELRAIGGTDRFVFAVGFGGTILRYTLP